jgi:S-adenosylmethionine/arginine decarboxylase-like enzyme
MIKHHHLLVRADISNPPSSVSWCTFWLKSLVSKIDMKILKGPIVAYSDLVGNRGMTGVVVIETSHIALHCWDETFPYLLQLDVYSCKEFDEQTIFDELAVFKPKKIDYKFLDRESNFKNLRKE